MDRNRIYKGAGFATVALAGALASWGFAGPLDKSQVPADASWVAHIDVEAFSGSDMAKMLLGAGLSEQIEEVKSEIGIDPLKDALGITVYATTDSPEDGAILISATSSIDAVLAGLSEEGAEYEQIEAGGRTIDSWSFDEGRMYSFTRKSGDDRLIVAAENLGQLQSALSVLDGKSASLSASELKIQPAKSSWVYVAGIDISNLPIPGEVAPMVESVSGFSMEVGETEANAVNFVLAITTATAEAAVELQNLAYGVMSMVKMQANSQPDLGPALALLDSMKINADGTTLSLSMAVEAEVIKQLMSEGYESGDTDELEDDM